MYGLVWNLPGAPCSMITLAGPGRKGSDKHRDNDLERRFPENQADGASWDLHLPSCTEKVMTGRHSCVFFTNALGADDASRWSCKTNIYLYLEW